MNRGIFSPRVGGGNSQMNFGTPPMGYQEPVVQQDCGIHPGSYLNSSSIVDHMCM